jgi:hypothetical protein
MEAHGLRQKDLAEVFGTESIVSDVLMENAIWQRNIPAAECEIPCFTGTLLLEVF